MANLGYQATEEDVENVLSSNPMMKDIAQGRPLEVIAAEIFLVLDMDRIEEAALMGDDLDEQTNYANDNIAEQLREQGILEPLADVCDTAGEPVQTPKG